MLAHLAQLKECVDGTVDVIDPLLLIAPPVGEALCGAILSDQLVRGVTPKLSLKFPREQTSGKEVSDSDVVGGHGRLLSPRLAGCYLRVHF